MPLRLDALGRSAAAVLAGAMACLALGGCSDPDRTKAESPLPTGGDPPRSVILILNDTMRRDYVGAYGGSTETPFFDGFARENLLFERAYTQAPWTKPSIATLFTSLYPSEHAVIDHPKVQGSGATQNTALSESFETLAERMRDAGLVTAAFVSNPWMQREFGFAQGFDTYDDSFARWDLDGEEVSRAGLAWLKELQQGRAFFLYLHYIDSHRPYPLLTREEVQRERAGMPVRDPGEAATRGELARAPAGARLEKLGIPATIGEIGASATLHLVDIAYGRGVEKFDRALGSFLDEFRKHPAWPSTAIVITSDHGEALYQRGFGGHGKGLYDDELAVPMAARFPGISREGYRVSFPVGLIDLMPTLLGFLGVAAPAGGSGRNILELLDDPTAPTRPLLAEGVEGKPKNRSIRRGEYKLLVQPQRGPDGKELALFHIDRDPKETRDLLEEANATPSSQEIVRSLLEAAREATPASERPDAPLVPVAPETLDRLRELGYME